MSVMFCLCLPVDVLIFYAEPFGVWGTLAATILSFSPFLSMVADSTFPVKEIWVKGKSKVDGAGRKRQQITLFTFSWSNIQSSEEFLDQTSFHFI